MLPLALQRNLQRNLSLGTDCYFVCSLLVPPHRWMEVIRSATSSASRTRALSHKEPHAY